jgi:general secretion pathway protein D
MKQLKSVGALLFVLAIVLPGYADQASAAYKRGTRAESHNQIQQAYEDFREAHTLKPKDPKYYAAFVRTRFHVAAEHVRTGQQLEAAGKLQEALAEFQLAAQIDHTNFVAEAEARQTVEMIRKQERSKEPLVPQQEPLAKQAAEAAGPVELQPLTNNRINLRLSETVTFIYKTIGKLAGINVLFDSDFKSQRLSIELNDVTLREALDAVALQSKTFWQPTAPNTILVAADTPAKRKELQATVMKAFYLKNVSTAAELQDAASTLKGILDISRIQIIPTQNELVLRGTPDQMVFAQLLLQDIDKPKSEVMMDIAVLQVSRNRIRDLGAVPPSTISIAATPNTGNTSTGTTVSGSNNSGGSFTLNSLRYLNGTNFTVTISPYSFTALASDADTKVLQKPQLWALNNEKATLKIGDRIPIATGSFGATGGTQGYGALVNTQFQYIDVGVNIDITPHIHSQHEVTLKMTLEISSVTGTQNIGGINQPTIGQRRAELELRLQDGEINLVGGILEDTETQSLSGYPGVLNMPILKYLFAQENKQRQENEIVFAITPHIVRSQEVTDENLRLVDLGAGNAVTVRHVDSKRAGAAETAPATPDPGSSQGNHAPAGEQNASPPTHPPSGSSTKLPTDPGANKGIVPPAQEKPASPTSSAEPVSIPFRGLHGAYVCGNSKMRRALNCTTG